MVARRRPPRSIRIVDNVAMSALGQKRTFAVHKPMSALPPIATAKANSRKRSCPLYPRKRTCAVQLAMSALGQKRTSRPLFDHLVSAILHRLRHGNAERLRGLEVEEQLDFACLLHRQVGGFLALENTADVPASEAVGI
jgi:hypothetical protein